MATKRELDTKAKSLLSNEPKKALDLYREIWEAYPQQVNEFDAFFALQAMRKSGTTDLTWANAITERFKNEKVGNIYAWLIFDSCVKGKEPAQIKSNETVIRNVIKVSPQKDLSNDDQFPCPVTICLLQLADAFTDNIFNARKVEETLSLLNFQFLSRKTKTINTLAKGEVEMASDLEKCFSLRTKALLKLEQYDQCRELCVTAFSLLDKFHYNNDLWLKMRIALAEDKLGNHEASEALFTELLSSKAGSDKWFLYRDIAEVYFEQQDYPKAWKYAVDGAFYGNEPHFLVNLYLLQARILIKLNRESDGKLLAELIGAILNEQQWNEKPEHSRLFAYYHVSRQDLPPLNEVFRKAQEFWKKERYGNQPKVKGIVVSTHPSGKKGRIKAADGTIVAFHKKDLLRKVRTVETLKGAAVAFYSMQGFDGQLMAESIEVLQIKEDAHADGLQGKVLEGTVKSVVDFGVFVRLSQKGKDGLLHKNTLSEEQKHDMKILFPVGKKISVKVSRVTDKGIQLEYVGVV